jgi:hypothetical protein
MPSPLRSARSIGREQGADGDFVRGRLLAVGNPPDISTAHRVYRRYYEAIDETGGVHPTKDCGSVSQCYVMHRQTDSWEYDRFKGGSIWVVRTNPDKRSQRVRDSPSLEPGYSRRTTVGPNGGSFFASALEGADRVLRGPLTGLGPQRPSQLIVVYCCWSA